MKLIMKKKKNNRISDPFLLSHIKPLVQMLPGPKPKLTQLIKFDETVNYC